MKFTDVQAELYSLGVNLRQAPGEYHIYIKGKLQHTTDDLADALDHGRMLAAQPKKKPRPPIGPLPRMTRRTAIRQHNKKLLKRWNKEDAE